MSTAVESSLAVSACRANPIVSGFAILQSRCSCQRRGFATYARGTKELLWCPFGIGGSSFVVSKACPRIATLWSGVDMDSRMTKLQQHRALPTGITLDYATTTCRLMKRRGHVLDSDVSRSCPAMVCEAAQLLSIQRTDFSTMTRSSKQLHLFPLHLTHYS